MKRPADPLFVAERAYRRRRLADAARLLPLVGVFLFILPLIWAAAGGLKTSTAGVFVFGVWIVLILAASMVSRGLSRGGEGEPPPDEPRS